MTFESRGLCKRLKIKIVSFGIGLAASFWIVDSFISAFFFLQDGQYMRHIFSPEPNELWMRSLSVVLLCSLYTFITVNRLKKEKEVGEARERVARILDLNLDAVISVDEDQCITLFNQGAEEVFGYGEEEVLGRPLDILLPVHHMEEHKKHIQNFASSSLISRQMNNNNAIYGLRKDGSIFPAEASISKFDFKGEKILAVTIRDISERRRAEEELQQVASDLARLIETANTPIFVVDTEGRVKEWNRKMVEITGFRKGEVRGRHLVNELINGGNKTLVQEVLNKALRGEETSNFELPLNTKQGRRVLVLLNTTTRRDASGAVVGVVGVGQDITERKNFEVELARERENLEFTVGQRTVELRQSLAQLEAANLQLQQANQHKSRFLSSMSHELRTPLNAVLGFSDLLKGQHYGSLNEKQSCYVEQIEESGKHLLSLINGLLDIAKIDAGRMAVQLGPFSWDALIHAVTSMMSTQFQQKRLALEVNVEEPLKLSVIGDEKLCRQILFNLLSNAVKFTPPGEAVAVRADAEDGRVRVSVADTGIGIHPRYQEKIFSEFHQVDGRHQDGAGIGLALTRRLVELLGGEISVESAPGVGSTFTFTLPLRRLEASPDRHVKLSDELEVAETVGSHRILVAEDNEVNLAMILDMLATQGNEVAAARNGKEAVDLAVSLRPELILMDIKMPVMDGLEATRRIRKVPELAATPIVALTASVGQEDIERCLAAGCSDHLPKPVQSKELFAAIATRLTADEPGLDGFRAPSVT